MIEGTTAIVVAALVGLIAGGGGSMVGAGGGFIVMPFLLLVLQVDHNVAVATSLVAVLTNGSGSTFAYARQKRIDYVTGLTMSVAMIPGALTGGLITQALSGSAFRIAFGVVIGTMALIMIRRSIKPPQPKVRAGGGWAVIHRQIETRDGIQYEYPINIPLVALAALAAGVLSNAFGIGGGMILVPVMVALMGVPVHVATSTSTFVMIPMALLGVITHTLKTPIDVPLAIALALGVLTGSQIGARLSQRFRPRYLTYVVATVVTLLAALLIYRGLNAPSA